eukprot:522232-Amphidinium_carterae.1
MFARYCNRKPDITQAQRRSAADITVALGGSVLPVLVRSATDVGKSSLTLAQASSNDLRKDSAANQNG